MRKILSFVLFYLFLVSCVQDKYPDLKDGLYAKIQTAKGNITVQLEYEKVPITVANFVSLAEGNNPYVTEKFKNKPFYDGLVFHSIVKNYSIQGGDPLGSGEGSPGYQFEDEFPTDEKGNLLLTHYKKGIISMANGGFDTNGAQFFITLKATPHLDGVHTVFGNVVEGIILLDSIESNDVMQKVEIIRKGKKAKQFNAPKVFGSYFKKLEEEAEMNVKKAKKAKANFLEQVAHYESNADSLASGLKIYFIKKGDGQKPKTGSAVKVYYSGYFTSGDLFSTNDKEIATLFLKYNPKTDESGGYSPKKMDYSQDAELIPGFKEGLQQMNIGDKVMLFIPSHLGYASSGRGPIPPDTDLIFELEIVE